MSNIFSDYNVMKLEINSRREPGNFTKLWKLSNTLLSHHWVKEEIKKEIGNETNNNKYTTYPNDGIQQKQF